MKCNNSIRSRYIKIHFKTWDADIFDVSDDCNAFKSGWFEGTRNILFDYIVKVCTRLEYRTLAIEILAELWISRSKCNFEVRLLFIVTSYCIETITSHDLLQRHMHINGFNHERTCTVVYSLVVIVLLLSLNVVCSAAVD